MSKEMINTNKAVIVYFPTNKSQGTASIYIPFPVKEIHVKGVDIDWLPIDINQWNLGLGSCIRHGLSCRGIDSVYNDRVNARSDEILNLRELVGNVVLCVFKLQLHTRQFARMIGHALGHDGDECEFKA